MSESAGKSGSRFLLGAVLFVVVILALAYLVGDVVSQARWYEYAAELREGGVPLTFEEIEVLRTPIPDEHNGARVIERLVEQLSEVKANWAYETVFVFGQAVPEADFFKGIARYRIEPSREFLEKHRNLLHELSALYDIPTGRFDLPLGKNLLEVVWSKPAYLREAAELEQLDGMLALIDGDLESAAATVRIQAHIAATLNEYPTVIGRLVQIAIDARTVRAVENILRVGTLDEQTLIRLDEDVRAGLEAATMRWAFLGERAVFLFVCDQIASGELSLAEVITSDGGDLPPVPEMVIRANQVRGAEILTWLVEAADDPKAMTEAAKRVETAVSTEPITHILVKSIVPSLSRAVEIHLRVTALQECTRAALAAERFRLHKARLPTSIEEVIPDYLGAVPTDPFSGKPMRFAVTDDGIVIYSVNSDGKDDGGDVAPHKTRPSHPARYPDIGFRLFRPDRRGLLIIDELPPDGD